MRFQLACFDLDGTLVDSEADIRAALVHALEAVGPPDGAKDSRVLDTAGHGMPLDELFTWARPGSDPDARARFVAAYRGYYHAHLLDHTRPFPGVAQTLQRLEPARRVGLRTVVATTKKTDTATRVLEGLALLHHFDAVVGSDDIPYKPAPDVLLLAGRRTGRDPATGVMVGDTPRDIQAGRAAGMVTCGVSYGGFGRAGLGPAAPDHLIDAFPELLTVLEISG